MLKTERNTKTMGARVLRAFRKWAKINRPSHPVRSGLGVFFEHGQWWAQRTTPAPSGQSMTPRALKTLACSTASASSR